MTTTSFATGDDFLSRYDARLIGDLVRDDGTQESAASLPNNENLLAALSDGYGQIVSAVVYGNRYTLAQLDPANLSVMALSVLRRLNCDLALIFIKRRRGKFDAEKDAQLLKETQLQLKDLKSGESMLLGALDANAQASTIGMAQPELIPIEKRNTIRFNTRNYYPTQYPYYGKRQQYTQE